MAAPGTSRSQWAAWAEWFGFWLFCFGLAAIAGHRHREFGVEFALAVALLMVSRLALGVVGGRVFIVGFALGVVIEWACYYWIASSRVNQPGPFASPFPFTFQYEKVWPPLRVLMARPEEFSNVTGLNNGLAALGAGSVTSGLLVGLCSLLAWYRLAMRSRFEKLTRPVRRRIDRFNQSERRRRIAISVSSGTLAGTLGLVGWWRVFGPLAGIMCAILIFTIIAAIPWFNTQGSRRD